MRRLILALSAVAALLLGLEKVGLYQFVPGGDTRFECTPLNGQAGYLLRHANSAGNLTSWVRLIIRGQSASEFTFVPVSWTGDPLAIESRSLGYGRFEVTISKKPNPPKGTPFVWGAGLELQIADARASVAPVVDDWAVFPSGQAPDSSTLAARRRQWTIASWILLPLAALGAMLTALKEREGGERVTTRTFAVAIINDIVGETPADTKKLHLFMRRVLLEEVPVDQALIQVGYPNPNTWPLKVKRYKFQARAIQLFRTRVDNVVAEFDRYNQRLSAK